MIKSQDFSQRLYLGQCWRAESTPSSDAPLTDREEDDDDDDEHGV